MNDPNIKAKHDAIMQTQKVKSKISSTMKELSLKGLLFTPEHRKNISYATTGLIYINKDGVDYKIHPDDLEFYLQEGYSKGSCKKLSEAHQQALIKANTGRHPSEELRKQWSNAHKGKSPANKGVPISEDQRQKLKASFTGRKWMNNGVIQKQVKPHLISTYIENGFTFGQLPKVERG